MNLVRTSTVSNFAHSHSVLCLRPQLTRVSTLETKCGYVVVCGLEAVIPYVEELQIAGRTIYLFARGAMANLVAGQGDTINAFDVTLATIVAGLRFMFAQSISMFRPGLHPLPRAAWQAVAEQALV